jgi:hypothetical protein
MNYYTERLWTINGWRQPRYPNQRSAVHSAANKQRPPATVSPGVNELCVSYFQRMTICPLVRSSWHIGPPLNGLEKPGPSRVQWPTPAPPKL